MLRKGSFARFRMNDEHEMTGGGNGKARRMQICIIVVLCSLFDISIRTMARRRKATQEDLLHQPRLRFSSSMRDREPHLGSMSNQEPKARYMIACRAEESPAQR